MNDVKHSPGPWAFSVGDADRRSSSEVFKADDNEFRIASVMCEWANKAQRAEDIANARLIAAAPDMLYFLEKVNALNGASLTTEERQAIKIVIAKATSN